MGGLSCVGACVVVVEVALLSRCVEMKQENEEGVRDEREREEQL